MNDRKSILFWPIIWMLPITYACLRAFRKCNLLCFVELGVFVYLGHLISSIECDRDSRERFRLERIPPLLRSFGLFSLIKLQPCFPLLLHLSIRYLYGGHPPPTTLHPWSSQLSLFHPICGMEPPAKINSPRPLPRCGGINSFTALYRPPEKVNQRKFYPGIVLSEMVWETLHLYRSIVVYFLANKQAFYSNNFLAKKKAYLQFI